jgi:hypothetical protein
MRTSATNRKTRVLLTAIREGRLEPRPEFQRRLVWSNKHKQNFLETVLKGYPFPEIYIASGSLDGETGEGVEMLVDGQQRITTLNQYFLGSPDLKLGKLPSYRSLPSPDQLEFLEYEVVVRDLGPLSIDKIREIFERINSTRYSLNAMEIHNARFDGAFKQFGEEVARDPFFDNHRVFLPTEARRMGDLRFALVLLVTMLTTYFNRDDALEEFLTKYNDDFPQRTALKKRLSRLFEYVDAIDLPAESRAWQKADLLTLLVEVDRALETGFDRAPASTSLSLMRFYSMVDGGTREGFPSEDARAYYLAAVQASNDRSSRIRRGAIVERTIRGLN